MKKLLSIIIISTMLLSFSSCSDSSDLKIWDIAPVTLNVMIVDEQGNSLLDPACENNIIGTSLSFTDGKEEYAVDWDFSENHSRAYLPHFRGAIYVPVKKWSEGHGWQLTGEWEIQFGELDGAANYDLTFNIEIMEQQFELRVHNNIEWKKGDPKIKRHFYLNGIELENSRFTLVVNTATAH